IEAGLWLMRTHGIDIGQIRAAETVVSPFFRSLCEPPERKRRPQTAIGAKFSIPFTLASTLRHGRVGLTSFSVDAMQEPDVLGLADRISHVVDESWTTEEATQGTLTLHLTDGRTVTKHVP